MIAKPKTAYLKKIKSPADLKKLSLKQLGDLACEIRPLLIRTVAKNGGHLASNLGTVELILALHYIYSSPRDKIIFDVGHQAYTHKILTGRLDKFASIRKMGGLSGYLKHDENEHDIFGGGHVGTAVSAALGIAEARDLKREKYSVVAVIGDGSMTNGLTYEGINNIGDTDTDITIVLNDNKWSISRNVGGIAKYLERLSAIRFSEDKPTDMESIFHALGFSYFGPIDGHDLKQLTDVLQLANDTKGPKIIHVITKKGLGYYHSEMSPDKFHSINPFILESGKVEKDTKILTYTSAFSNTLIKIAKKDKRVIGITAAMPAGTGLDAFAQEYPERFYDTGIAESHAVTFAAGLASQGFRPVVAIYSSFLQRAYDQILHDVCLQKLPVIFAIDRAGIVGSDGPTHHGLFDLSFLRSIPNLIVLAPKDENELQHMLYNAVNLDQPVAIRYPRGIGVGVTMNRDFEKMKLGEAEKLINGYDSNIAILAIGTMVYPSIEAAKILAEKGIFATVYNARSIKPIDEKMIANAARIGKIITVEENILDGGFGSAVLEALEAGKYKNVVVKRIGIEGFVEHGEISELRGKYGLTAENIVKQAELSLKGK